MWARAAPGPPAPRPRKTSCGRNIPQNTNERPRLRAAQQGTHWPPGPGARTHQISSLSCHAPHFPDFGRCHQSFCEAQALRALVPAAAPCLSCGTPSHPHAPQVSCEYVSLDVSEMTGMTEHNTALGGHTRPLAAMRRPQPRPHLQDVQNSVAINELHLTYEGKQPPALRQQPPRLRHR